jgi:hypothetical protein
VNLRVNGVSHAFPVGQTPMAEESGEKNDAQSSAPALSGKLNWPRCS